MLMMYRMLVHLFPKASVSTPEDVCNRIKKNLTGLEKEHFSPRMSSQREYAPRVFVLLRI